MGAAGVPTHDTHTQAPVKRDKGKKAKGSAVVIRGNTIHTRVLPPVFPTEPTPLEVPGPSPNQAQTGSVSEANTLQCPALLQKWMTTASFDVAPSEESYAKAFLGPGNRPMCMGCAKGWSVSVVLLKAQTDQCIRRGAWRCSSN
jgi:hypothetical protein